MKTYNVYFSYYSEQYGTFEEATIKADAENQFEARRIAWEASENSDDLKFASNIKVCGVTWDASPLDLQDYFNAQAALEKYRLKGIESVEIPNAKLNNASDSLDRYERQKAELYGSLQTISQIAADFGKPHNMLPPTAYEELHYAREFLTLLEGPDDFNNYNAFLRLIERAEQWDSSAIYTLRDQFKYGRFEIEGMQFDFSGQYSKDGLYPDRADLSDSDYKYIYRWQHGAAYKTMSRLPFFGEKDVIAGSEAMQYDWQTLVLKRDVLRPESQIPVNSLWIANQGSDANFDKSGDGLIVAENPFTEKIAECKRSDFIGVLRPEIAAKIDYEAIKQEHQASQHTAHGADRGEHADDDEWDMEV